MFLDLHRMAYRVAVKLVLLSTLAACFTLERLPVYWLLAAAAVLIPRLFFSRNQDSDSNPVPLGQLLALIVAVGLATLGTNRLTDFDGRLLPLNMDLGYFAQLAEAMPESGVASLWSAALGPATQAAGETKDVWYHWGPIFLTALFSKVTGLAPLKAMLWIVAPLLNILLALTGASLVSRLTGWRVGRCLVMGVLALLALSFPAMSQAALLMKWLPTDIHPHIHVTLASQFSYKFEGILILAALSAWLGDRIPAAVGMLFAASISAPQTVALGGLTAGILGCHALLTRDRRQLTHAAVIILTCIAAWASMKVLFGVGLPKMGDSTFIDLRPAALLRNFGLALADIGISALLSILILPGLLHLWRKPQTKPAALLAISALIGSHLAYRMLLPDGDRAHFTMLAHAVLILPIGTIGLAQLALDHRHRLAALALALVTCIGLFELRAAHRHVAPIQLTSTGIHTLSTALQGRPFGYLATRDRNWWISQHAVLAGHLGTHCLRLNKLPAVDEQSEAARFYGSSRIEQLVPRHPGETDSAWALRLAHATGIRHIMQFPGQTLPPDLLPQLRQITAAGGHVLWDIH